MEDPHRYQGFASDERRATSDPPLNLQRAGERRVLGQLGLTYIVCEGEGGALVLIDQHAAHERLRYDELKRQYSAGNVAVQHLLLPERIELPPKESAYLRENIDILSLAGFEVEPFGGETLLVKAVPALLGSVAFAPIFEEMAVELEEYGGVSAVDDALDKVFALVACHAQVRAGDKLTLAEMNALVTDILCYNVQTCPHGRPVVFKVLPAEIEKWFKRA